MSAAGSVRELCRAAAEAAPCLAGLSREEKDRLLKTGAAFLREDTDTILAANKEDMEAGEKKGLSAGLLDRLRLTPERIEQIAQGIEQVALLPDPVGKVLETFERPNGLHIRRVCVPIGTVGMIYEARPNVTADVFALCMKTGNAVVLRGGSDALCSNHAITESLRQALRACGLSVEVFSLLEEKGHEATREMMKMREYLDLLIPRGGAGLIRTVVENSSVPVIETGSGNCFLYVDETADIDMALKILINGKTQRVGVCNALESLLVHKDIAEEFLPAALKALKEHGVTVHGDGTVCRMDPDAVPATEEDWGTEYLDYQISARVIGSVREAVDHINRYHTKHSDCIVTRNEENAELFRRGVDSACVYVNASTRFTDGFEFGLGAEIGISTQKLHARGPMGLEALTTYKYLIDGNGQTRP